jgi:hypothetical protein
VDDILAKIPAHSTNHRVLSLCFVDPFDIGIKFETLRKLSERYMDFLVLLALYMDANRNIENYVKEEAVKIDTGLTNLASGLENPPATGDSIPPVPGRRVFKEHEDVALQATAVLQDEGNQDARTKRAPLSFGVVLAPSAGVRLLG